MKSPPRPDSLAAALADGLGVEALLGLLDQGEHVAHVEDPAGHPVGVEHVEVGRLLAVGREHHRLAGDRRDRQGGATAGVAVELGEDDAVVADAVEERLGGVDRVLADHRVDDEEDLVGVDGVADVRGLLHHLGVDAEAAGGVDDHDVVQRALGLGHAGAGDRDRVADAVARLGGEHLDADPLAVDLELVDGVGALEVGGHEQRAAALLLEPQRQLGGQRRLAGALEAGEHQHGRRGLREAQPAGLAAEDRDELLVDDLDDLLGRVQRPADLLAAGPGLDRVDERLDHRQRDVGLEQGDADLAGGRVDVGLREPSLAAEVLERRGETVGEGRKHRISPRVRAGGLRRAPRFRARSAAVSVKGNRVLERPPDRVHRRRGPLVAQHPGAGLLHVEHVDRLRAQRGQVRRAHRRRRGGPARRRPGTPRPAGPRPAPPARWPRARRRGGPAPTARARPRAAAAAGPRGPASRSTTASSRCRRIASSRWVSSTSHTETARSSCVQARADRIEARCTVSAPAMSAIRPVRSPDTTVTVAPSARRLQAYVDQPRVRTDGGRGRSTSSRVPRRPRSRRRRSSDRACRTRRARSATSPARQDVHAWGEVARASASVSTSSRSSVSTSWIRADDVRDGGRVLEVAGGGDLGQQQVPAHQAADQGDLAVVEAHPGGASRRPAAPPPPSGRRAAPCRGRAAGRRSSARRPARRAGSGGTPRCRSRRGAGRR